MTNDLTNSYSEKSIGKIESIGIFPKEDIDILKNMSGELQRVFSVRQVFRTETEMRFSVLDDVKFPTIASKYWQSIREQHVMFQNLVNMCFDYDEAKTDLDILKLDYNEQEQKTPRGKLEAKKIEIKIKRLEFSMADMVVVANDYVREIKTWESLKNELLQLDKTFDTNNVNTNQLQALELKWKNELEIAKKFNQPSLGKNALTGITTMENSVIKNKKELTE